MSGVSQFKKYPLTFGPSPITELKGLSKALGGKVNLFAKREDCNSGLAFGGNKLRKLEYIVPDILEGDYTHLVSIGGRQSNQTRMVAALAAHLGKKCVLIQENWVPIPEAEKDVYDKVGNIELSRIMGADVRVIEDGFDIGIRESFKNALAELEEKGEKPFPIPAGCSEHPKGGLGFVGFADEVVEWENSSGTKFDKIVVCCVTGSTTAGIIAGFAQYGREADVIAIDASFTPEKTKEQTLRIANNTAKLIGLDKKFDDFTLDTRFAHPCYGVPNDQTIEAIRLCAETEGVLTDPVYEGKSMQGMIQLVKEGAFKEGDNVLYVHLGGAPALSAYSSFFPTKATA
ncbi:CYFA0S05e01684g1_1 [Cyberlindnera fabianii]|uniref:CYFA0S05e01684g1_1 n=1 Tax=Cyberlindnera fabianii TaxID=36022 RepID=A0A061B0N2_CYBFA|nr:CYFA0S05e01684g1_1 [Cyberlindnera fabianii]